MRKATAWSWAAYAALLLAVPALGVAAKKFALPVTPANAYVSAMVQIPAGKFVMGAAPGDVTAWASELPVHEVVVPAFESPLANNSQSIVGPEPPVV